MRDLFRRQTLREENNEASAYQGVRRRIDHGHERPRALRKPEHRPDARHLRQKPRSLQARADVDHRPGAERREGGVGRCPAAHAGGGRQGQGRQLQGRHHDADRQPRLVAAAGGGGDRHAEEVRRRGDRRRLGRISGRQADRRYREYDPAPSERHHLDPRSTAPRRLPRTRRCRKPASSSCSWTTSRRASSTPSNMPR